MDLEEGFLEQALFWVTGLQACDLIGIHNPARHTGGCDLKEIDSIIGVPENQVEFLLALGQLRLGMLSVRDIDETLQQVVSPG